MNVNTDGDKDIEMADKDDAGRGSPHAQHGGHDHDGNELATHTHVEEEECALESDTRTVHLD